MQAGAETDAARCRQEQAGTNGCSSLQAEAERSREKQRDANRTRNGRKAGTNAQRIPMRRCRQIRSRRRIGLRRLRITDFPVSNARHSGRCGAVRAES